MFSLFRKKGSMPISKWWDQELTREEHSLIEDVFQPLGNVTADSLVSSNNPGNIGALVGHLKQEPLRHLGYKLLNYADTLVADDVPALTLHFYWASRGEFFYRWRNHDSFALDEAESSFRKQIGLASNALRIFSEDENWGFIPAHAGYRQLRIIEEKRGNLSIARSLCIEAKAQGWADDWDKHIARIDKKLAKLSV